MRTVLKPQCGIRPTFGVDSADASEYSDAPSKVAVVARGAAEWARAQPFKLGFRVGAA